jgi:hypothetical protein
MSQHDDGFGGNPRAPMTESGPAWKEPAGNLGRALQTERKGPAVTGADIEQMLAECLPGGDSCDPQSVADAIRTWFVEWFELGAEGSAAPYLNPPLPRDRLPRLPGDNIARNGTEGSAAAPAERADLLKRLHGIADGIRLYGTPDHELAADRIDAIGVALAQPVSPAPEPLTIGEAYYVVMEELDMMEAVFGECESFRAKIKALVAARASQPVAAPAEPHRVWPFVESPGEFTERLAAAYSEFGTLLAAVRCVLIEKPAVLARPVAAPEALTDEQETRVLNALVGWARYDVPLAETVALLRAALASQPVAVEREES